MKLFYCLILLGFAVSRVCAQLAPPTHEWNAKLQIVDDTGHAVEGANASIIYAVAPPPGKSMAAERVTGLTDTNGWFAASHQDGSLKLVFQVKKAGYYDTSMGYELGLPGQPYDPSKGNISQLLVLKRIIHPIPMYAKWVKSGPPILNQPVGYDFMIGDWTAPHGKGRTKDMLVTKEYEEKSPSDYYSKITITFPNDGDGIQEFIALKQESELRSSHEAPADGYQPQLAREVSAKPGQPSKFDYDENRNYYFRVRTILDEKGNIKSCLHGKIYGDLMHFRYYLNPTPNSRNVEFDPRQNLLKGLNSLDGGNLIP